MVENLTPQESPDRIHQDRIYVYTRDPHDQTECKMGPEGLGRDTEVGPET